MEELKPISCLVRNERGVLARVAGLFARRGFNITSLAVGETEDPRFSRISVVVGGDDATLEQVVKQLQRLVSVVEVEDLSQATRVERGLAMIKVKATPEERGEVIQVANIFRARIAHVDPETMVVEVTGVRDKIQAMIDMLTPFGIVEMARTGQIAVARRAALGATLQGHVDEEPEPESDSGIYNIFQRNKGDQS